MLRSGENSRHSGYMRFEGELRRVVELTWRQVMVMGRLQPPASF